jgi:hypothetical protein
MKKLCVFLIGAASFAACRSSNGPQTSGPAVMPSLGSEFTYQVIEPTVQLQERTTITSVSNDSFAVTRRSDTENSFFTSDQEQYVLSPSGDLFPIILQPLSITLEPNPLNIEPLCDSIPLPIASHLSFVDSDGGEFPTKLNGVVDQNSSVIWETHYDGEETITAAGTSFPCSEVSETLTIIATSGSVNVNGGVDTGTIIHHYWYSPQLGFFVKDQELTQNGGGTTTVNFTRMLVSYKLGK